MKSGPERASRLLGPGERLLWTGQPRQGIRFYSIDWLYLVLSFGVGATFTPVLAESWQAQPVEWIGVCFGLAVFSYLVWFWVYRLRWDRDRRRRTTYFLTDRHAFIVQSPPGAVTHRIVLGTLRHLSHVTRRDGSGTIAFGKWWPEPPWSSRDLAPGPSLWRPGLAFEQIQDAQAVFALIQRTRASPAQPG
jgi:hypothetical protein